MFLTNLIDDEAHHDYTMATEYLASYKSNLVRATITEVLVVT